MKTPTLGLFNHTRLLISALACAGAVCALAPQAFALTRAPAGILFDAESGAGGASGTGAGSGPERRSFRVQAIEPEVQKVPKEVAWLGLSTEEAPDALSSQLGLQNGDGLVVIFVQADSPAAKAGVKKNDVLVQFGDQLLVHPGQFKKLVRRQKEGDTVNLTLFRSGKKQALSATLAKTMERADTLESQKREYQVQLDPRTSENVNDYARTTPHPMHQYVALTRQNVDLEVERSIEEARQALQDALVRNQCFAMALGGDAVSIQGLTCNGNTNATVTLTRNGNSVKTIVKADTNGTYVIVANPNKRLTVHDKDGKMVFDDEIETKEEQQKVPADLWPEVEPMLKGMASPANTAPVPKQ
jgi:hypothetical protein